MFVGSRQHSEIIRECYESPKTLEKKILETSTSLICSNIETGFYELASSLMQLYSFISRPIIQSGNQRNSFSCCGFWSVSPNRRLFANSPWPTVCFRRMKCWFATYFWKIQYSAYNLKSTLLWVLWYSGRLSGQI